MHSVCRRICFIKCSVQIYFKIVWCIVPQFHNKQKVQYMQNSVFNAICAMRKHRPDGLTSATRSWTGLKNCYLQNFIGQIYKYLEINYRYQIQFISTGWGLGISNFRHYFFLLMSYNATIIDFIQNLLLGRFIKNKEITY